MAQFLRPDSNITQTSFNGGFAEIDESSASDADYAWSANNTAAVLEVGLSNPGSTPGAGTTTVRHRIAKTDSGTVTSSIGAADVTCAVYQGGTLIATDTTRTPDETWTTYSFTPDMSAVTDWSDVRLRFTTTAVSRRGVGISWAEVEAPDGGRTGDLSSQLDELEIAAEGELALQGEATPTLAAVALSSGGSLAAASITREGFVSITSQVSSDGSGNVAISLSGLTLQQNDLLVLAFCQAGTTADHDLSASANSSGAFTEQADLYANDNRDTNLYVGTLLVGATPDTTITVSGLPASQADNLYHVIQYRGVDTSTPMDVTATTATGIDTDLANPPAITPSSAGAKIVAVYAASQTTSAAWGTPANVSNFQASGKLDRPSLATADVSWAGGAFDPDAVPTGNNNAFDSWAAVTLALRPTVSSTRTSDLTATLGAVTLASAGTLPLTGAATPTLGDLETVATGALALQAALAKTLGAITLSATGEQEAPLPSTANDLLQIKSIRWVYHTPSASNISGWSGNNTILVEPWRAKWIASVELAAIQGEAKIRAIRSFLAKRKGQLIPFRLYASEGAQNANSAVTVSIAASAGATSIAISGASTTLKEGQFVTVNGQLLCLTADQSGSTLSFRPPLRAQANAGTTVVTSRPYALVHMASARSGWMTTPGRLFGVSFDVEEAMLESDPEAVPEAA